MVGSAASKMDCGWMCVPAEKWSVIYGTAIMLKCGLILMRVRRCKLNFFHTSKRHKHWTGKLRWPLRWWSLVHDCGVHVTVEVLK